MKCRQVIITAFVASLWVMSISAQEFAAINTELSENLQPEVKEERISRVVKFLYTVFSIHSK